MASQPNGIPYAVSPVNQLARDSHINARMGMQCVRCDGAACKESQAYGVRPLCKRHHREAMRLLLVSFERIKQRHFTNADGTAW